jgi:DNA-binding NarL/FixJ family response regulator
LIQVLLVAPALAVRAGLRALLAEDSQIEVIGEAAWLGDLMDELPGEADVLVLLDAAFAAREASGEAGGGDGLDDGLEALLLASEQPAAVLLLVSGDGVPARRLPRVGARAWGVLPLDSTAEELQSAVRALHHGLLVGSPELIKPLMQPLLSPLVEQGEPLGSPPVEALTERELQVLQLLAQGLANKQIAVALSISEHTVKFHVSGIYAKLGAASRTEAVRLGVRQGFIVL